MQVMLPTWPRCWARVRPWTGRTKARCGSASALRRASWAKACNNCATGSQFKHLEGLLLALQNGSTALVRACSKGYVDIARLLLDNGANLEAKSVVSWLPTARSFRWRPVMCAQCLPLTNA